MKPLLQTPVTREQQSVGDWIPSKAHAGHEGIAAFWQRQQERIAAAQAVRAEAAKVVRKLPAKGMK